MFSTFNTFVGIGTYVIMAVVASIWLLVFLGETKNKYYLFLKKHSFHFAFLLALSGLIGSLMYSDVFKLPPCYYCWWQRIFMYPQVIILGVALYLKDLKIWITAIILSAIGALFSTYHIMLQAGIRASGVPCEALGGVSCTKIDVLIFDWITIPIMCLVLFIGILTFAYLAHRKDAHS